MANKKINQLVAKTTIQSTDLFPLGDPTTGQLFKKTVAELQAAIGGAVISVNGLTGVVVLDTDDVQELASPTNRYFTEARARAAISLTTTGSSGSSTYSNSTGVLNVPTYTLAGLGGITASFLSGGTGITYNSGTGVISYSGTVYTDSSIRALFSAGTGISYNSSTGAISYSGTVYTDASIRALISLTTSGSSGASTYNNTTGVLNVPTYTLAGLGGISLSSLSGSAPITYNSSTGAIGITQASTSANGFLSSTDWNTFNNKQGALTLTTTGTSGASTLVGSTLNIPQYQAVLTNPVTGTGTTNYVAKFTSSSTIGNSSLFDTGSVIGIGTATPTALTGYGGLVINGTNGGYTYYTINGTDTGRLIADSANFYIDNVTTGNLIFRTTSSSTERMRLDTNGTLILGGTSSSGTAGIGSGRGNLILGGSTSNKITFNNNSTTINGFIYSDSSELNITGSGYMVFNTGGSERIRILSGGNVGVGITSPNEKLMVNGAIVTNSFLGNNQTSSGILDFYQGSARIFSYGASGVVGIIEFHTSSGGSNSVERMRISQSGNLEVNNYVYARKASSGVSFTTTNAVNADWEVETTSGGLTYMGTSGNVMAINRNGGNVLIGTTTNNGERLYVSGSIRATGSITANSDVRLKKNLERIENALQKVSEISGYTYNTIYDEDRHAGVIAQEIDKVLPEIVNKGNDGLMGVEYGNISALLIEAIKDLKKDNESLRAIVEGLRK